MCGQVNMRAHNYLNLPSFPQKRQGIAGQQGKRERDSKGVEKGLLHRSPFLLYMHTLSLSLLYIARSLSLSRRLDTSTGGIPSLTQAGASCLSPKIDPAN